MRESTDVPEPSTVLGKLRKRPPWNNLEAPRSRGRNHALTFMSGQTHANPFRCHIVKGLPRRKLNNRTLATLRHRFLVVRQSSSASARNLFLDAFAGRRYQFGRFTIHVQ